MGWTKGGFAFSAVVVVACQGGGQCLDSFGFQTHVLGGARSCVTTFTLADASLQVTVGDLDGGCGAYTNSLQFVTCASDLPPDTLTCQRGCFQTEPDLLLISAREGDAAAQVHAFFGNPPQTALVGASVECNGTSVASGTASLESCGL